MVAQSAWAKGLHSLIRRDCRKREKRATTPLCVYVCMGVCGGGQPAEHSLQLLAIKKAVCAHLGEFNCLFLQQDGCFLPIQREQTFHMRCVCQRVLRTIVKKPHWCLTPAEENICPKSPGTRKSTTSLQITWRKILFNSRLPGNLCKFKKQPRAGKNQGYPQ